MDILARLMAIFSFRPPALQARRAAGPLLSVVHVLAQEVRFLLAHAAPVLPDVADDRPGIAALLLARAIGALATHLRHRAAWFVFQQGRKHLARPTH